MPIYEYLCQACRRKTEAIQRVGERPLRICPHCGGKLKKAFSAAAIQFKGSGWYVTDYARAKAEATKEPSGEKKEPAPSETKETAPGEKKEAAPSDKPERKEAPEKPKKAKASNE